MSLAQQIILKAFAFLLREYRFCSGYRGAKSGRITPEQLESRAVPFRLTGAQAHGLPEARGSSCRMNPMNRLDWSKGDVVFRKDCD